MNKELNIGDYVRTDNGKIYKIKDVKKPKYDIGGGGIKEYGDTFEGYWYTTFDYTDKIEISGKNYNYKSSPKIIDLIQEGDYVDGDLVYYRPDSDRDEKRQVMNTDMCGMTEYIPITSLYKIKSIVTKEQFESMKYKIGE